EDGIRDFHVTGVQTCALPIWAEKAASHRPALHTIGSCEGRQHVEADSFGKGSCWREMEYGFGRHHHRKSKRIGILECRDLRRNARRHSLLGPGIDAQRTELVCLCYHRREGIRGPRVGGQSKPRRTPGIYCRQWYAA